MGDNLRLTLFVAQRFSYDGDSDGPENAVVTKLVGSRSDMLQIAAAIVRGCNAEGTPLEKVTEGFVDSLEAPKGRH
ncbi:hypothetical protein [Mesorhizobium helmanticense]|uniref:Uncharacterized protein n=1 Tax=Mesorhizobium helmanticense TaxID=1776423 RepID=A0A2T4J1G3_9HYPH|nr:hypothetical protein [Mesorhizobium helmanticense]PTE11755.1 hypothetical protein C9427_03435 [Mesorhizobium helmanticense]